MSMTFKQIRSATAVLTFGGVRFLIDPWFADKGAFPPIPIAKTKGRASPMTDLPVSVEEILAGVDAVVVTHLHFDHFESTAAEAIPKDMPLFGQDEIDAEELRKMGFSDVRILRDEGVVFKGVTLYRTACLHGQPGRIAELYDPLPMRGEVAGVVFVSPNEPKKFYLAADTIWFEGVRAAIECHRPEVIALNAAEASCENYGRIIMGIEDIEAVHRAAPEATLIATHMDAVGHAELSRADLRRFIVENHYEKTLLVPEDGEVLSL